jgi:hypothetical protein
MRLCLWQHFTYILCFLSVIIKALSHQLWYLLFPSPWCCPILSVQLPTFVSVQGTQKWRLIGPPSWSLYTMSRCRVQTRIRYTHTRPVQHTCSEGFVTNWSGMLPVIWIPDPINHKSPEAVWACIHVHSIEQGAMDACSHARCIKLHCTVSPYSEPDQSSSHPCILHLLRSILILSSHLCFYLSSGPLPTGFRTKTL